MRKRFVNQLLLLFAIASAAAALGVLHPDLWLRREVPAGGPGGGTAAATDWNERVLVPVACAAAGLLALAATNLRAIGRFFAARRTLVALNVGAMVLLTTGILVVANWIGANHPVRFDWTYKGMFELSPRAKDIAALLARPATVHVFLARGAGWIETVYQYAEQFRAESAEKLAVKHHNPALDRIEAEAAFRELGVEPKDVPGANVIVFRSVERTKIVPIDQLFEHDYSHMQFGLDPTPRGHKIEDAFVSALLEVTSDRVTRIHFLAGHDEVDLYGTGGDGLSELAEALRQLNYKVEAGELEVVAGSGTGTGTGTDGDMGTEKTYAVPEGTDLLAIVGPRSRLSEKEVQAVRDYLEKRGGRLLLLADPAIQQRADTKAYYFEDLLLNRLLEGYGVRIEDAIVDDLLSEHYRFALPAFLVRVEPDVATHAANRALARLMLAVYGAAPLALDEKLRHGGDREGEAKVAPLVETTDAGIAIRDLSRFIRRDPNIEVEPGKYALAAAASKKGAEAAKEARIVVVGDADLARNASLRSLRALDLLLASIAWLTERESEIGPGVGTKPPEVVRLSLSEDQRVRLYLVALLDLPLACMAIGATVWYVRRRT